MSLFNPPDQLCECGRMKVSIAWSEGAVAAIHGAYNWICKICALERQIAHAEERAASLPKMYEDYATLKRMVELLDDPDYSDQLPESEATAPRD